MGSPLYSRPNLLNNFRHDSLINKWASKSDGPTTVE